MITLKTLSVATAQEVFEQGAKHLLSMSEKSVLDGECKYRHPDLPLKCAGGCFIADDEYDPQIEGWQWRNLVNDGSVPDAHSHLISSLQHIHDEREIDEWADQLEDLASELNLVYNPSWEG